MASIHILADMQPRFIPICELSPHTKKQQVTGKDFDDNFMGVAMLVYCNTTMPICKKGDIETETHRRKKAGGTLI